LVLIKKLLGEGGDSFGGDWFAWIPDDKPTGDFDDV